LQEVGFIAAIALITNLEPKISSFPDELALLRVRSISLMAARTERSCVLDFVCAAFSLGHHMVNLHTEVVAEAARKMGTLTNGNFDRLIEWHDEQDKAGTVRWRLG
jgi:hypothetical protein